MFYVLNGNMMPTRRFQTKQKEGEIIRTHNQKANGEEEEGKGRV
jgi:hypothetical protein